MPTTPAYTFSNNPCTPIYNARGAKVQNVKLANSLTLVKGTVLGQITASGLWTNYLTGSSDGSQTAKVILQYDTATDASGNHTIGAAVGGGPQGEVAAAAPVLMSGYFRTVDLTGLDAGAITSLGRLVSGSLADGVLVVYGD